MPDEREYTLVSDGTPKGTKIFFEGVEVPWARSVDFSIDANSLGTMTITIMEPIVNMSLGANSVVYTGLEDIPIEALIQEIDRRRKP